MMAQPKIKKAERPTCPHHPKIASKSIVARADIPKMLATRQIKPHPTVNRKKYLMNRQMNRNRRLCLGRIKHSTELIDRGWNTEFG
jgi:hypothetical protein